MLSSNVIYIHYLLCLCEARSYVRFCSLGQGFFLFDYTALTEFFHSSYMARNWKKKMENQTHKVLFSI